MILAAFCYENPHVRASTALVKLLVKVRSTFCLYLLHNDD